MSDIEILLSDSSKKKLKQVPMNVSDLCATDGFGDSMVLGDLLLFLKVDHSDIKHNKFDIISLEHFLLDDLSRHFDSEQKQAKKKKANVKWEHVQLLFLLLCGVILFGCEGFDSIFSILSIFSLPSVFILGLGMVFSLLSIGVFFGFELMEISKNLGVNMLSTSSVLDGYIQELETIQKLHKQVTKEAVGKPQDKEHLQGIACMLIRRLERLEKVGPQFELAVNHFALKVARLVMAILAGSMYFGGGFFAGQTVSLAVVGMLGISAALAFWPVLGGSVLVGLAGLSVYWYVERPGVQNLIGKWVGLDRDKINRINDAESLDTLKQEIEDTKSLIGHMQPQPETIVDKAPATLHKRKWAFCDDTDDAASDRIDEPLIGVKL